MDGDSGGRPRYCEVIHEFQKLTGIPILLNTSFNNNAEPIVNTPEEAIVCFLTTGLNYLVLGDYLASKKELDISDDAYQRLVPDLPTSRRLVKRKSLDGDDVKTVFEIEGTMSRFFARTNSAISEHLYSILDTADGKKSLRELFEESGIVKEDQHRELIAEILELWSQRIIILRPQRRS